MGYKDFVLSNIYDGYIFIKPVSKLNGCTIDTLFLTKQNWQEAALNTADPDWRPKPNSLNEYWKQIAEYADIPERYSKVGVIKDTCTKEIDKLETYLNQNWRSPEQYIIDKFKDHDVILLSEDHAIKHNLEMAQAIIPALYKAGVYNFGMEFGAEEDQKLLDSIITAPEYNEDIARRIMFNYNVGWVFKEYMDIYRAAWKLNKTLPAKAKKFRVLNISYRFNWAGCDPRYFGIRTPAMYQSIFNRGNTEFFRANIIKREILDKKEKILVLTGIGHAYTRYKMPYYDFREKNFYRCDTHRMGNLLYNMVPKKVFTILLHYPFDSKTFGAMIQYPPANGYIDAVMKRFGNKGVGFDLIKTPFGALKDSSFYSIAHKDFRLKDMADGYIFQKPFEQYEGCTIDEEFLTEKNWPEVVLNFPDKDVASIPENKDAYLDKIRKYVDLKFRYRNLKQ
jgi:hypothetical protein